MNIEVLKLLNQRDQAQLFCKSIDTENIDVEYAVPNQVFYGESVNTHYFWSIANARRVIGHDPEDNSEVIFADRIAELAKS